MAKFRDRIALKALHEKIELEDRDLLTRIRAITDAVCPPNERFGGEQFYAELIKHNSGDILQISANTASNGDGHYTDAQKAENVRRKRAFEKLLNAAEQAGFPFSERIHGGKRFYEQLGGPDSDLLHGRVTIAIRLEDDYEDKLKKMEEIIAKSVVKNGASRA